MRNGSAFASVALLIVAVLGGAVVLPAPSDAATNGSMIALGDSVPAGGACSCEPFPLRYAGRVSAHTGRAVHMTNDAFGGATSDDVVAQLRDDGVRRTVADAGTALVMIGANDFGPAFRRVLAHHARARVAFPRVATRVHDNLVTIIRELRAIRPHMRVVVADYWNVMKDGDVGRRAYGDWGLSKADQATSYANTAIRNAASAAHAIFVSTYSAFKGSDGSIDPTPLLAADGDHPDSRGHGVITRAFFHAAPNG
jgi:lysophospholipase L1-like esterase